MQEAHGVQSGEFVAFAGYRGEAVAVIALHGPGAYGLHPVYHAQMRHHAFHEAVVDGGHGLRFIGDIHRFAAHIRDCPRPGTRGRKRKAEQKGGNAAGRPDGRQHGNLGKAEMGKRESTPVGIAPMAKNLHEKYAAGRVLPKKKGPVSQAFFKHRGVTCSG